MRRALDRDGLRQPFESVLGGHVPGLVRRRALAVHARDVHETAPATLVHAGQEPLCELERHLEHDSLHPAVRGTVELRQRRHVLEPRVVDDDVDRLGGDLVERIVGSEVTYERSSADLVGNLPRVVGIVVEHDHIGAGRRELHGAGTSDAARGPGDEGATSTQRVGHVR